VNPLKYFQPWQMWKHHDLQSTYDVVVIGGGVHGLATAYELAKRGVKKVVFIDRNYIGSGGSGRNTTIIRANYRTPEGVDFYRESLRIYQHLSQELDYNLLFSEQGHLTLAHTDRAVNIMVERAAVNRLLGVDSRVIGPEEIGKLCPYLDLSSHPAFPIQAALYHPPGAVIRHDAVVWGYARAAERLGVEIHPYTEVTGITREGNRATGVKTNRGDVAALAIVACVAGWSTEVARLAGVELPIQTHVLQAFVTEPLKPFLHVILVSATLHIYVSQTDRGEVLIGAEIEPYTTYSQASTLGFLESSAQHTVDLLPVLRQIKVLRTWSGLCDVTPDYSPIMGKTDVDGFFIDGGWGTYGFKAAPISGVTMAELVATGKTPRLIEPFGLSRFWDRRLVSELAAAAVSH